MRQPTESSLTSELLQASITPASSRFRFGVNYVPRRHWWYCWQDWDRQAIYDDFRAIADLGMDHIRVQCIWPFFQPEIDQVSELVLESKRQNRRISTARAATRSWIPAECTITASKLPCVFTAMCRLRPLIFLPAS